MSLIDEMSSNCILLDKQRTSDGEGGFKTSWVESATFQAAVIRDSSTLAQIAEKQGVSGVYTVTTSRSVSLSYPDVFKRVSDGQIFRVTTREGEQVTPPSATLDIAQVNAELWELTS